MHASSSVTVSDVAAAIRSFRFTYATEDLLQQGLVQAIEARGHTVEREVRLSKRDRVDLLVDGAIGVEVKIAGDYAAVLNQVGRYLQSERLEGLVLVTSRVRHVLPPTVHNKPVAVVQLAGTGL